MRRAFTLIELLVVVSIIALLIAILLPALSQAKESARIAQCSMSLQQQGVATFTYANDNQFALPYVEQSLSDPYSMAQPHHTRWFQRRGPGRKAKQAQFSLLWYGGYFTSGESMYCPSQKDPLFTYAFYSNPVFPTKNTLSVSGVRASYNHNPLPRSLTNRRRQATTLDELQPGRSMLGTDLVEYATAVSSYNPLPTRTAHNAAWNVLHGDGSVNFIKGIRSREQALVVRLCRQMMYEQEQGCSNP